MRLSIIPDYATLDCEALAAFSKLRNLLTHEYLDYHYPAIADSVQRGPELYSRLSFITCRMVAGF